MKRVRSILCVLLSVLLVGCASTSRMEMQDEAAAWNLATERTLERYNSTKELSMKYNDLLYRLFVYNEYNEALEDIFDSSMNTTEEDYDESFVEAPPMPERTFLESKRVGESVDSFDSYIVSFADVHNLAVPDVFPALEQFKLLYGNYSNEEIAKLVETGELDYREDLSSYLFYEPKVILHKYFTSMNVPHVMEIWQLSGKDGALITVRIMWADNKILYVDRTV